MKWCSQLNFKMCLMFTIAPRSNMIMSFAIKTYLKMDSMCHFPCASLVYCILLSCLRTWGKLLLVSSTWHNPVFHICSSLTMFRGTSNTTGCPKRRVSKYYIRRLFLVDTLCTIQPNLSLKSDLCLSYRLYLLHCV